MFLYLFLILIVARLAYWFYFFAKLALYKPQYHLNDIPISVVICVKNNALNLSTLLPYLLKQNFSLFEIIVVDDFSPDDINKIVSEVNHPNIKVVKSEVDIDGKKIAITTGIKSAQYDWILVTDVDCKPSSLDWIKIITSCIKEKTELVLGVSPLTSSASFISHVAKYESVYNAMQYLSYALRGVPYMGVGRNMLFQKKKFLSAMPYEENLHIASGDDDMIVQKIANAYNTEICIHPNAFTYSPSPNKFNDYLKQRRRHISTSYYYHRAKALLTLFGGLHVAIYLLFIANLFAGQIDIRTTLSLIVLMWAIMTLIQLPIFYKLKQRSSVPLLPLADLFLAVFYMIILFKSKSKKPTWN